MATSPMFVLIVVAALSTFASFERGVVAAFSMIPTFVPQRRTNARCAFLDRSHTSTRSINTRTELSMGAGALDQQPHESDSAYMKRLLEVASDSATFEKAVLANDSADERRASTRSSSYQRAAGTDVDSNKKKKGKYQKVEEWDAQRRANGTMTWEERVQFDGQQHGNRVNQNDILRHHLNTY